MTTTRQRAEQFTRLLEQLRSLPMGAAYDPTHHGLSFSHMRALGLLMRVDHLSMKDLADHLGMTPPSVTSLTRRLTALKLVERHTDPDDSRRVLLKLTKRGRAQFEAIHCRHLDRFEQLLSGLSDEEQELFLSLMSRAVVALQRSLTDE